MTVDHDAAREIVRAATEPGWTLGSYCLDDRLIVENDEVFVFRVGAGEWLLDGDDAYALAGSVPVVRKADGALEWRPSALTGTDPTMRSRPNPAPTVTGGQSVVDLDAWAAEFLERLEPALRAALERLVTGLPPESVVALGAYTDSDACSIVAAACTRAHWDKLDQDYPGDRAYFLFAPGEWDLNTVGLLERGEPDDLGAAGAEAEQVAEAVHAGLAGEDDYTAFRFVVWEVVVTALGRLFDGGFFDAWPDAVQVFDVPGTEIDSRTLANWMGEINTDEVAEDYVRYLTSRGR